MKRFVLVTLLAGLVLLPTVRQRNLKDCGASSRLATVESLVERGTLAIDGSTFAYTCDVLERDGRRYSDKPPLLSVGAAGVYYVLHHLFGMSFNRQANPERNQLRDPTYGWMTVLVVVLAQALLAGLGDRAARDLGLGSWAALGVAAALCFATPLWGLSALFNSHTVAALLLFAGFRWLLVTLAPRPLAAGLALGLAATVDLPLGLVALALGLGLGPGRARQAMGAVLPLAAHGVLNWHLVGDLKPAQMHRELYTLATGHTGESATGFAQDAGLGYYAWRNLFGSLGAFALSPVLLLALGLVLAAARGRDDGPEAEGRGSRVRCARFAAAVFVAAMALYTLVWPQAVGCAYGMRHLTPAMPPLLLVAAAEAARQGRALRRAFVALTLASAVLAAPGLLSPATCAGFVEDARGYVPARVFLVNLRDELLPRLGRGD